MTTGFQTEVGFIFTDLKYFWVRVEHSKQHNMTQFRSKQTQREEKQSKMQNWKLEKLVPIPGFEQTLPMISEETIILFHDSLSLSIKM